MTALKTWSLKVGSPRFDKIVRHKINSGSRKCRQDLLQETIYRHNKQAVGKAKINTNEIAPIYQPQVCGQFRDSGREAEVMLMASFMVHFKSDLEKLLGEGGFCKLQHTWGTGHFDSKLLPEIQACRPDFKLADLGFTPEGTADQAALPEAFDMDEEEQANLRVLIGLARGLRKEQQPRAIRLRCKLLGA